MSLPLHTILLAIKWNLNFLHQPLLGMEVQDFLSFAVIMLIGAMLQKALSRYSVKLIYKIFGRFIHSKDDSVQIQQLLAKPMQRLLLIMISYIGINQIDTFLDSITLIQRSRKLAKDTGGLIAQKSMTLMDFIDDLFTFLIILYITIFIASLIRFIMYVLVKHARDNGDKGKQQIFPLMKDLLVVLVWSVGIATILGMVFSVNVAALIAGLGMGGIAIAFAAKESLENLLASFMIMMDKPFDIGDYVKISNVEGNVEKIGFRSTQIRTLEKTVITLPNKNLISNSLENYTQRAQRRSKIVIGAIYGLSVKTLKEITKAITDILIKNHPVIGTPLAFVDSFGDSAINIVIIYNTPTVTVGPFELEREKVLYEIYEIMYRYGHGFAFPTQTNMPGEDINEVFITSGKTSTNSAATSVKPSSEV